MSAAKRWFKSGRPMVQVTASVPSSSADFRRQAVVGAWVQLNLHRKFVSDYQTNELTVDSTEFGTRRSVVQIHSPRPLCLESTIYITRE
jgi:hypothetical protein